MLKRIDSPPRPEPDSLAGLFGRAKDEARAWLQAEVALYKTIGTEKANAWKLPVMLFAAALFLGHAALLALVATLFVALAQLINPALAGLLTVVILVGTAAILAKVGLAKLKDAGK
ncbi:MAG: phage holin family protein [Sphingomicrobium sp.]|nr:phage holin family protein [Sphingomonadales bacterium]